MDYMIPKFLALSEHPNAKMRAHALACLSYFVPVGSQSLFAHLDAFVAALFARASDDDPGVRRHVCQALVLLLAARADRLLPEMENVAEYMLYSTKDKNENVALEACEFWLTFAEDADLAHALAPLLPRVAPVLLDCMVYGEDDLLWLEADVEDDAAVPDKETDIKPRHYGSKAHGFEHDAEDAGGGGAAKPKLGAYGDEQADDDDDEDYDDDEFDDDMTTEWNLRKCAAAALDVLAVRFGQDLLNVLLDPLKQKLWSAEWLQRESAILALGAMAEGCIEVIEPHLPDLVPYLLNVLSDPKVFPPRTLRCVYADTPSCSRWFVPSHAGRSAATRAGARAARPRSTATSTLSRRWRGYVIRCASECSRSHISRSSSAWSSTTTSACRRPAAPRLRRSRRTQGRSSCPTSSRCCGTSSSRSTSTSTRTC
jgi:transportin-1